MALALCVAVAALVCGGVGADDPAYVPRAAATGSGPPRPGGDGRPRPHHEFVTADRPITVVVLNWARAEQLRTQVLPALSKHELVEEVLVSHGRADTTFSTPELPNVVHHYHASLNEELGLLLRFETAKHARTECILFTDDDVVLTDEIIRTLYANWKVHPYVVHGVVGRDLRLNAFGEYQYEDTTKDLWLAVANHAKDVVTGQDARHGHDRARGNGPEAVLQTEPFVEVPMVLTASAMTHRDVLAFAMEQHSLFDDFIRASASKPLWNGEDILLGVTSAVFNSRRGAPPDAWFARAYYELIWHVQFLSQKGAISADMGHWDYRSKCLRQMVTHYEREGVSFDRVMRQPWVNLTSLVRR